MMLSPQEIRNLRALKGWSMTELASRAGVHYSLIYLVECEKRNLTDNVNQKLLKAFEINSKASLDRMLTIYSLLELERR